MVQGQITGLACAGPSVPSTALQNKTNTSSSTKDSKSLHVVTAIGHSLTFGLGNLA